jgi:hypothetical protein
VPEAGISRTPSTKTSPVIRPTTRRSPETRTVPSTTQPVPMMVLLAGNAAGFRDSSMVVL